MKEIGSEFYLINEVREECTQINSLGDKNYFLRSGRDAIGLVADLLKRKINIILMPSYCCEAMVQPFISRGWIIKYYPILDGFSTDIKSLNSLIELEKPNAVLIMNFFGIADTSNLIDNIRNHNYYIQIIEDVTHILFDFDKVYSNKVDFYVASIRKWFGIIDGGLFVSNKKSKLIIKYKESEFVALRREAFRLKKQYISLRTSFVKDAYRRLFLESEISLNSEASPVLVSDQSEAIIKSFDYSSMIRIRQINARTLISTIMNNPYVRLPYDFEKLLDGTPFSVPILVSDRDNLQSEMAKKGLYLSVLWPLNDNSRKISRFSSELEESMLSIPVDQRYRPKDMEYICKLISDYFQEKS